MSPGMPMVIAHLRLRILSRTANSPGLTGLGKITGLNEIIRRPHTLWPNGEAVVVTASMRIAAPLVNGVTLVLFIDMKFHPRWVRAPKFIREDS